MKQSLIHLRMDINDKQLNYQKENINSYEK